MMDDEKRIQYYIEGFKFHKVLYSAVLIYMLLLSCFMVTITGGPAIRAILMVCLFGLSESIVKRFQLFKNIIIAKAFCILQFLVVTYAIVSLYDQLYMFLVLLSMLLLYMTEFVILNDIYESINVIMSTIFLILPIIVMGIVRFCYVGVDIIWLLLLIAFGILQLVFFKLVRDMHQVLDTAKGKLDSLNHKLHDLEEGNKELISYQNKVERVNEELNLQRIKLEQAYKEINQANAEMQVQANVLKYINTSFEVPKIVKYITESIIDAQKIAFCAIYIERGIYNNRKPLVIIRTEDENIRKNLEISIEKEYQKFSIDSMDTIIEGKADPEKFQFLIDTSVQSLMVRPLILENEKYGLLIAGEYKVDAFENKLSFYDATIAQFDVAINNARLYSQMEDMARKDGLTGINNRTYFNLLFMDSVKDSIANKRRLTVALFDIDKFKRINDTYGHLVGDDVIKVISKLTEELIDEYDGYICRYGGEEFVVVLPDKSIKESMPIIEELHHRIATKTIEYSDKVVTMNVSIGVTSYPETCDNPSELLKRADWSMYYAKEHGRGRIVVDNPEVLQK